MLAFLRFTRETGRKLTPKAFAIIRAEREAIPQGDDKAKK